MVESPTSQTIAELATPGARFLASFIDGVLQSVVLIIPILGILIAITYALVKDALPFLDGGLMPNIFGVGRADSSYGSADASLWFARAVRLLEVASGGDVRATDAFLPALTEIATAYANGTRLGIACDEGGLVRARVFRQAALIVGS
jgi:uncharacterized RDD family membrane protein YckC